MLGNVMPRLLKLLLPRSRQDGGDGEAVEMFLLSYELFRRLDACGLRFEGRRRKWIEGYTRVIKIELIRSRSEEKGVLISEASD